MFDTNLINGNTSLKQTSNSAKSNNGGGNVTLKTPDNNYAWWYGTDGNIWANIDGNVQKLSEGSMDYNGQGGSYFNGTGKNNGTIISVPLYAKNQIADPNPSNGNGQGGATSSANSALAAANAEKARRTNEAQGIKNSMAAKRGEFADILNQILGSIDTTFSEEVTKLDETRDNDKAELIEALGDAIPEIGNSFAAIGAYDSSQRAGSNADARREEKKAEEEIDKEYEDNKSNLGNKANEARNNARNAYNNFMIDLDTLEQTKADSDTLETLRQSQNSILKGLSDFGSQREAYKPGSTFANEISALNKYNGTKAKDAFSNFLNSAGASGIKANNGAGNSANAIKQNSNKKNTETELEVNQKTGVK